MLFKIFLYFLYIMNLSIYIVVAYYISKGNLAQVISKRFGVQILSAPNKCGYTVASLSWYIAKISQDGYESTIIGDEMGLGLIFKTRIGFRAGLGFVIICLAPPYPEYKITSLPFIFYKIPKNSTYKYLFPVSSLPLLPFNTKISPSLCSHTPSFVIDFPNSKNSISYFQSLGKRGDRAHSLWRRQPL